MAGKIGTHLRGNAVGYVAVFIALGGTAWAATELEKNQVKSKHIGKGQVREKDLARAAVTSPKVADSSLLSEDFAPGEVPAGPRGPEGPPGSAGERGPQGDRGEPGRDGILDAVGRSGYNDNLCLPGEYDLPDPMQCAGTSLTLTRSARVHLVADADWGIYGGGEYAGECLLTVDGAAIPGGPVTHPGERDVSDGAVYADDLDFVRGTGTIDYYGHTGLTHVTTPLDPGTHSFGLRCGQTDGTIHFDNATISALAISPD